MTRILLDCDPGHDDAIAIMLALASPEVELVGVSTVAGNQTIERTTANAIRVLDHLGRFDVPVARGAGRPLVRERRVAADVHGETGLDGSELPEAAREPIDAHAVDWLARTLAAEAEPATIVATGPLTNVALLLALHPDHEARIARVVLMGGAIGEGNVTPAAEFNMWADPEAAYRVFSSDLDVTMVGLDVTHRALLRADDVQRLAAGGPAGQLAARLYGFYTRFHRGRYGWDGAPVHDAVALAHVIDPTLLHLVDCGVVVDTGPDLSRGRTYVDRWGAAGWAPRHRVAVDVDASRLLDLIVQRIAALH